MACSSYKLERDLVGATQLQVAERTGLTTGRLRQIERGSSRPTEDEARRLRRAFGKLAGGRRRRARERK